MAFNWGELTNILSTIEDLMFMGDPQPSISISTGSEDDKYEKLYMKIAFPLKNGISEIILYYEQGFLFYKDFNGESLQCINFDDKNLSFTSGSFKKALKQVLAFDKKFIPPAKNSEIASEVETSQNILPTSSSPLDEIRQLANSSPSENN
ncbi:hypothetical protein [Chamaesiphon minutus]|uniref:Uncharacterized protein n=1 Tax=Chamaesiphon minutus (strain ATCC 27169 / PCC 6605) TaxID=1173020 RepID=K9UJD3_CHAP6|nr:hypothetical protein [Chamaesiphon minutus]AFY94289.1 hypothetical protein Cha6605_3284 [Chamaesiphon minutus PCC 6605]